MHQVNCTMVTGTRGRGRATANGPALPHCLLLLPRLYQREKALLAALAAVVVAAAAAVGGKSGRRMLVAGWLASERGKEWQCMLMEAGGWLGIVGSAVEHILCNAASSTTLHTPCDSIPTLHCGSLNNKPFCTRVAINLGMMWCLYIAPTP